MQTDRFEGVFQIIPDDGFVQFNGTVSNSQSQSAGSSRLEPVTTRLDNDLVMHPQCVTNHRNGEIEILVQDVNNTLLLISPNGKILWKKVLDSPILGKVEQVDLYKNNKLQYAFATSNRVYIIDRNGNNVGPFPVRLRDGIAQPLAVFDYDNNKNYRFLVVQGSELLMLNTEGKRVRGFNYRPDTNTITSQPKHFRWNNRDYIVFSAGTALKILNRRGQVRVPVREAIRFSGAGIYFYRGAFTTSSQNGDLVQVNMNGAVSRQSLKLSSNHTMDATSRTLVTLDENRLTIKQKTVELEYGFYTPPKIFYLNDKIYVAVTDLQSKKIYVFDSQARLQENFPIYGYSEIDMTIYGRSKKRVLVTEGEDRSVIRYLLN